MSNHGDIWAARSGIVTYEQAAVILHMSADTIRRIPTAELPRYKPGKVVLFDLDDLKQYLRSHKKIAPVSSDKVSQEQRKLIEFCADSARSRSRNRRTK